VSKRQNIDLAARRASILEAATTVFTRYGYARASMADIAAEAGLSRPALYAHFSSKEDVYRSLADALTGAALTAAEAAFPASKPFAEGLADAVLAKDLGFFRMVHATPHGAEILSHIPHLTADLHAAMEQRFARLIARRAPKSAGPAFALTASRAFEGIKNGAKTEAEFASGVRRFAEILARGIDAD
jgi:AcrR family transcriptional regulator